MTPAELFDGFWLGDSTMSCDGDHGGPICDDPECWLRPEDDHSRQVAMHQRAQGASNIVAGGCIQEPRTILGQPQVTLRQPQTYEDWEFAHERGICTDGCPICRENAERNRKQEFDLIPQAPGAVTLERTLEERGARYGDYGRMATVAQRIKEAMGSREHISAVERESLDMIATKIARILCGEPLQRDSWHDIAGFARLAENRCPAPGTGFNRATP